VICDDCWARPYKELCGREKCCSGCEVAARVKEKLLEVTREKDSIRRRRDKFQSDAERSHIMIIEQDKNIKALKRVIRLFGPTDSGIEKILEAFGRADEAEEESKNLKEIIKQLCDERLHFELSDAVCDWLKAKCPWLEDEDEQMSKLRD
jgi:hypothetical protein